MNNLEQIFIGIDIGGTKIMTGAINADGQVIGEPIKVPTNSSDPANVMIQRIIATVDDVIVNENLAIDRIAGIGIGSTGPIDIENGLILDCPQLPTLHNYPLVKAIEKRFQLPVYLNNDANCLIYGETVFGAGQNKKNVLGFTLGTGIGCAIVLNGEIVNGATGNAAEIWKSPYQGGIIEDYISGAGVRKIYKEIANEERASTEVMGLALKGDKNALLAWKTFGEHLSIPLSWAVNLFDPDLIILGGSIANAHEFFLPYTMQKLKQQICTVPAEKIEVKLAELGNYAGFIGAACLVLKHHKTENYILT